MIRRSCESLPCAAAIPNLFAVETLDTVKKADLLEKALAADSNSTDRKLNVYLQVNTSGEDSKSGLAPLRTSETSAGDDADADSLVGLAKRILSDCPHLKLAGLMTIGALQSSFKARDGEENPDFIRLRESRDNLQAVLGIADLKLSMGMSNDFAEALRSGSDSVR